jgi:hypothetical protein
MHFQRNIALQPTFIENRRELDQESRLRFQNQKAAEPQGMEHILPSKDPTVQCKQLAPRQRGYLALRSLDIGSIDD